MQSINLIAKHLNKEVIQNKIIDLPKGSICAFTGEEITRGNKLSRIISGNFTDQQYIKHPSDYIGVDAIICLKETHLKSCGEKYESIRLRNFLATELSLRIIPRDKVLSIFFDKKEIPFVMCIGNVASAKCMKNLTYKSVLNYDNEHFVLTSEQGLINVNLSKAIALHKVIQKWYGWIDEKQKATFFNKTEIRTGQCSFNRIERYGIEKFQSENAFLEKYRKGLLFTFLLNFTYAK